MSNPISAILARQPVLILDGALATELEKRGADLADPLWSARVLIEQPALIQQGHHDYFLAGADVATTASYQATFEGFARRGFDAVQSAVLMRRSVELAVAARDAFWAAHAGERGRAQPLVAASVGPYGAMLANGAEYRGQYGLSEDELMAFHRERIRVLLAAGADCLACETIPSRVEARAIARLLASEFPGACAWLSFSCCDDAHICEGDEFAESVAELDAFPQIAAIGLNCTSPRHAAALLQAARPATSKPLLAYPNSGEQYDPASKQWSGTAEPETFAAAARTWQAAGATLIGGCCRTTPADICAISDWARA
ncbi:homocysteine S-methyltransferase [Chitinivorax sp. PXF-14]|uniref:homocysteine S-methyltransferase n=1 Tax=Chitinivorax sp. PXF-14 TaxID=3230488 RepID=UPI003465E393